jgi:RNA polymerase sigma factor (sigma-70 family)
MATAAMVMKDMHRLFDGGTVAGLSDAELLEGFLARRDEEAFAALVARHGAMVLGTCRAVLHDAGAVEDVFQATFLVLARKAGSVRGRDALGGWLHRVAFRAAVQANRASARRRLEERKAAEMRATTANCEEARDDLRALIHAEVERLPEALRLPVVLCDLGGLSREQAAAELRWTQGAVRGRLARGRAKLKTRLARQGVAPTVAALSVAMAREATAAVPGAWVASATRLASASLAGKAAAGASGAIASGVIRAMRLAQLKLAAGVTLGLAAAGGAALGLLAPADPAGPARPPAPAAAQQGQAFVYHGRVLGPDGKPFEGARLTLATGPQPKGAPDPRARSGPDGRFRFELARAELPADFDPANWDQITVVASADGLGPDWASLRGYGARGREPGPDGDLVLKLVAAGAPIEGRVLDVQGRPVAGASVRIERIMTSADGSLDPFLVAWRQGSGNAEVRLDHILFDPAAAGLPAELKADAQGRFRIAGLGRDRAVRLVISGRGIAGTQVLALARDGLTTEAINKVGPETEMFMGKPTRGSMPVFGPKAEVVATTGRTLDGVVREAGTGRPLAGVKVNGSGETSSGQLEATTDAQGRYRLTGLPVAAPIRLQFYPKGGLGHLPAAQTVPAAAGAGPMTAEVEMARAVDARGRVVERGTGKPVAGSVIYQPLVGNVAFRGTPSGEWIRQVVNSEQIGRDGTFRIPVGSGPGVILVQIQNPGGPGLSPEYLPTRRDPNDGAKGFDGKNDWLVGAMNQAIPLDLYHAYAVIDPKPGDADVVCELKVERGASRDGRVLDPAGQPLAGAEVAGLGGIFDGPRKLPGSDFTATLVDPARPRYLLGRHAGRDLAGAITLKGDSPAELKLEPAAIVTGRVVDADGRPIAGARVGVGYQGEKDVAAPTTFGRPADERILTDRDGRFRVEGVIAGLKTMLWASKEGRPLRTGAGFEGISLRPGEVKDLGSVTANPFQ